MATNVYRNLSFSSKGSKTTPSKSAKTSESIKNLEVSTNRLIDRKVDHKELKQVIEIKADRSEVTEQFLTKAEFLDLREQSTELQRTV